ncbi:MAG: TatD family deoxyribonuclease [Proteobacteria bacterium]|nr:TatD family deoxyribonuclease [Pseudomonadota bacterium]NBY20477.1 TatD family deoxyribonuclease [bacterium]
MKQVTPSFIDTHAHLGMLEHSPISAILERAKEQGISKMITVSTHEESWRINEQFAANSPDIYFTLGLHPHDAEKVPNCENAIRNFYEASDLKNKCVAIGETGLDFYYNFAGKGAQISQFETQVNLAKEWNLPLVIHCREAFQDLFSSLSKVGIPKRTGVMHCFTGTSEEALESIKLGFSISFSGIVTFKNAEALRETAKLIPEDRLLIETDCPFLAPVPHRGKKNEPSFLPHTAHVIATARGVSVDKIAEITTQNALRLFALS